MRRTAVCLSVVVLPALAMPGCATVKKMFGGQTSDPGPYTLSDADLYVPPVASAAPATQDYPEYKAQPAVTEPESAMPQAVAADPANGAKLSATPASRPRTHTVARKDTLYSLARYYYGDQRRWKDIYQANRIALRDPNRIYVGQRLTIP